VAWLVKVVDSVVLCLHGPHEKKVCFRVVDAKVSVGRVDILQGSVLAEGRLQEECRIAGCGVWSVNDETNDAGDRGTLLRVQVWWGTAMRRVSER
jgi:hypothetical protein